MVDYWVAAAVQQARNFCGLLPAAVRQAGNFRRLLAAAMQQGKNLGG
ncbi:hypothetical protein [Sunxiuqinia elliptica]|nr:hypothetical protein [Sunxiuqinia elliptica]